MCVHFDFKLVFVSFTVVYVCDRFRAVSEVIWAN
jgi:hypothetical protein